MHSNAMGDVCLNQASAQVRTRTHTRVLDPDSGNLLSICFSPSMFRTVLRCVLKVKHMLKCSPERKDLPKSGAKLNSRSMVLKLSTS